MQATRALRRDRNAYWKAITKETEGPVLIQGNFIRCSKVLATGRPERVRCYLHEMEASSKKKPENYVDGERTSRGFSITQHPRSPYCLHRIPPRRKITLVKLTRPLWRRCALPSDSCAITEPLERMSSQRRFTRRASTPWNHGCIG